MIIYKVTNQINGKIYIGQTTKTAEQRLKKHWSEANCAERPENYFHNALLKYGIENFTIEVIDEANNLEELNEKEIYWIAYYNTYKGFGYNCNAGGGNSRGENNGRTNLTNEDVAYIRECYDLHLRRRDVYEQFKDKITFSSFASIWDGTTWKDIKQEVYTEENKQYYKYHATDGENSVSAILSDKEVINCRKRYVNETAKEIYQDYKDRLSYQTLQSILWGRSYKHLPIYSKKKKEWINK